MSEPVGVWRGPVTEDAYGNPVHGAPVLVATWQANVADDHYDEPAETGRAAVLIGGKLYIEGQGPTGILSSDLVEVRGEKIPVDGTPTVWRRKSDNSHRGDVVTFRRADG